MKSIKLKLIDTAIVVAVSLLVICFMVPSKNYSVKEKDLVMVVVINILAIKTK